MSFPAEPLNHDQRQWQYLLQSGLVSKSTLTQAWHSPRQQGQDLCAVLCQAGALTSQQAQQVRSQVAPTPPSASGSKSGRQSAPRPKADTTLPDHHRSSGQFELGSRDVIGPYELLDELGRGGMGVVFKARHQQSGQLVALKVTPKNLEQNGRDRFEIEGQTLLRLRHPHIVRGLELQVEAERPYLALELIEGGSLKDLIQDRQRLSLDRVLELGAKLAEALHFAHRRGVVHRDVKPANVLLRQDGTPLLTDFGLAKELASAGELTRTGDMIGTPAYMAPEQLDAGSAFIDGRADVYGLGVTLFEAATGAKPFESETALELMAQVVNMDAPSPREQRPELPVEFETIIARCLQKEPERRYDSAGELAEDCQRLLNGRSIFAQPVGFGERLGSWSKRHRAVLTITCASFMMLLFAGLIIHFQSREAALSRRAEQRARADKARAEEAQKRAEAAQRQAENTLHKVETLSSQLRASSKDLKAALEQSQKNVVQAYVERARAEFAASRWFGAGLYAAEAIARAEALGDRQLYDRASAIYRSADFHNPCVWRSSRALAVEAQIMVRAADSAVFGAGDPKTMHIWDADSGLELLTVKASDRPIFSHALSPSGRLLATGEGQPAKGKITQRPPELNIWSIERGEVQCRMALPSEVLAVHFLDEHKLYAFTLSGALLTIDHRSKSVLEKRDVPLERSPLVASFSQDGQSMVMLLKNREFLHLDTKTMDSKTLTFPPTTERISLFPDGSRYLLTDLNGSIECFQIKDSKTLWRINGQYGCAEFMDNGDIVTGSRDGSLTVLDGRDASIKRHLGSDKSPKKYLLCLGGAGQRIAVGAQDKHIEIHDLNSLRKISATPKPGRLPSCRPGLGASLGRSILNLDNGRVIGQMGVPGAILINGPFTAALAQRQGLAFFKSASAKRPAWILPLPKGLRFVQVDRTGTKVGLLWLPPGPKQNAAQPYDRVSYLQVWDLMSKKPLSQPLLVPKVSSSLDIEGQQAILAAGTRLFRIDLATGDFSQRHTKGLIKGASLSTRPDCSAVIVQTGVVKLLFKRKRDTIEIVAHRGGAQALDYSPNGQLLATGGADRRVVVWDAKTGVRLHSFEGHSDVVTSVTFVDDQRLLTYGGDLRLWRLPPKDETDALRFPEPTNIQGSSPDERLFSGINIWHVTAFDKVKAKATIQWKVRKRKFELGHCFDASGNFFASDGFIIQRYDAVSKSLKKLDKRCSAFVMRATDKYLYTADQRGVIRLCDSQKMTVLRSREWVKGLQFMALSPDQKCLYIATARRLEALSARSLETLWSLEFPVFRLTSLVVSPDSERVILSSTQEIRHLNSHTGQRLHRVLLSDPPEFGTLLDPQGQFAAGITKEHSLRMWDSQTGTPYTLVGESPVNILFAGNTLAFSWSGRYLIVSEMKRGRLFDTRRVREAHKKSVPLDRRLKIQALAGQRLRGFELGQTYGTNLEPH